MCILLVLLAEKLCISKRVGIISLYGEYVRMQGKDILIFIWFIFLNYIYISHYLFIILNKFFFIYIVIWFITFFYLNSYNVVLMLNLNIFTDHDILLFIFIHSLICFNAWIPLKEWVSISNDWTPFISR